MNTKRKALGLAVAAVVAASAIPAHATVTGVVGEALLMPLMMNDDSGRLHETYVQITVPKTIGRDFVINKYLATHVNPTGAVVVQGDQFPPPNFTIHWVAFNQSSEIVQSGYCYASPGDSVVWTSNGGYVSEENDIDKDMLDEVGDIFKGPPGNPNADGKIPSSICGPEGGIPSPKGDLGYVVFETLAGAKGQNADFVMTGTGWVVEDYIEDIADKTEVILPVPVLPMVDGKDAGDPLELPQIAKNEVITAQKPQDIGVVRDPFVVAPLAAGVRMNNGVAPTNEDVGVSATVQGNWDNDQGYSMHVFWFDNNNPKREAYTLIWDEHEANCNIDLPLPHEVNVWVYNVDPDPGSCDPDQAPGWNKVESCTDDHQNYGLMSINDLLKTPGYPNPTRGDLDEYCPAPFWDETNYGYAEYLIPEQNDVVGGRLSSAAVFFEAQEDNDRNTSDEDAWATQPMATLGTQ